MSGAFWVYVNERNNKALVHEAQCSYCNDGRGMDDYSLTSNGEWLGPFNHSTAEAKARNSGKEDIHWCGHCTQRLGIKSEIKRDQ